MAFRDQLTSQRLRALFKSTFDLAAYAIGVARYNIRSGKEVTIDQLLDEVRKNPHQLNAQRIAEMEAITEDEEDTL
jgi:hypothetical protein